MNMPPKSPYTGGAGVAEYLMRTRLYRQLTESEATALWQECRQDLIRIGLPETIEEVDTSRGGSLDTLPRGDVLDALARVFAGMSWPANMASEAENDAFIEKMKAALLARGYARAEAEAA